MSQLFTLTKQLVAAVTNGIATSQTLGGAGPFTINGSLAAGGVATMDTARRIGITSAGNDSAVTFTVLGTDYARTPISESIKGANAGVAATQQDFLTVTGVTASAATSAVTIGTTSTGSTPWFVPDYHITPFEVAVGYELLSGAQTATVETTDDSVLMPLPIYQVGQSQALPIPIVTAWPGMAGLAANATSVINRPVSGIRLTVTAGVGQGRLTLRQSGLTY